MHITIRAGRLDWHQLFNGRTVRIHKRAMAGHERPVSARAYAVSWRREENHLEPATDHSLFQPARWLSIGCNSVRGGTRIFAGVKNASPRRGRFRHLPPDALGYDGSSWAGVLMTSNDYATLVNLLGFVTGGVLYAMLLYMVLRAQGDASPFQPAEGPGSRPA